MPSGESFARHLLYSKRYLSQLFDIKPEALNIDFEPDTFGHSLNVPEILAEGGVKYYYHCRGYDGHNLYRWVAPSGSAVTVYHDPFWYNGNIEPKMALYVPEFCAKNGVTTMLKVFGVGDHGGGPTRRDLERIEDMNSWPIFPSIHFGTFAEFFALVEPLTNKLPIVKGELNFVFTGCYTSQSRIKMANRIGEATLNEAEAWSAIASISTQTKYPRLSYEKAWRNILLNQFHDILPGSGVIETREHAMGLFQNSMAIANSNRSQALRNISALIDTSKFLNEENEQGSTSEGAGVGYGIKDFKIAQIDRGKGKTRIFQFFNSSGYDREEVVEIIIWDWKGDLKAISFSDEHGAIANHQVLGNGFNNYWGHDFLRILVFIKVPALGYSTYLFSGTKLVNSTLAGPPDKRVDSVKSNQFVLESDFIKVTFHSANGTIISLIDKTTNEEMVDVNRPAAVFRHIEEDSKQGMSAWWVGRYMSIKSLHENNVTIKKIYDEASPLRQSIHYEIIFGLSLLKVTVSLDKNSSTLNFYVVCDWQEIGKWANSIPQLNFFMPFNYQCKNYKYDIPFGSIDRTALEMDVPGNSWGLALRSKEEKEKKSFKIVTQTKYGFRGFDNAIALTLLRSSFDPDPHPDQGIHRFQFGVCLLGPLNNKLHIEHAYQYNHPIQVISTYAQQGILPMANSFATIIEGNVAISGIKAPEETKADKSPNQWIIRLYETEGSITKATLQFAKTPRSAHWVDLLENFIPNSATPLINGKRIIFEVPASKIVSLWVAFE